MRTFYKRFSVITGFGILLLLLVANAFVIRRQLGVQISTQRWVVHTREVLSELNKAESLLTDAETGQRGYLYTGEPKYLAPYRTSSAAIAAHLQKLANLTADNPAEQARVAQLQTLTQQKRAELEQTIALYQSGKKEAARKLVVSDAGLIIMNNIHAVIQEMRQEEDSLFAQRTTAYEKSIASTIASIYLASLLAALGLILLAYFILREMNLRAKHAVQMREREEWYRVTLTSVGDGVVATDAKGAVTFLNPVAEQLTGRKQNQAKGHSIQDVFPIFNEYTRQPVANPVKKVMESGKIVGLANHTVLERSDGTFIPIEDSAAPIRDDANRLVGVVLVFRDATHERKSQEILRKTEKLAAAARLAATVSHEINNPLEAVGNLVYLAKAIPGVPADASHFLSMAEQELQRISHITRQTLGFYRESNSPESFDVNTVIDSALNLYGTKFRNRNIKVEREFATCPHVSGLPGELRQLVAGLVSNAADAVGSNGTIRVTSKPIDTTNGTAVQVTVEDDGPGIAPEHIGRIFEPFFTTKDIGTGLGLWVAKEIAERHGGSIEAFSKNEAGSHGAVFRVTLSCASDAQSRAANVA